MQLEARAEHEQLTDFYRLLLERAWYDGLKNSRSHPADKSTQGQFVPSLTPDNSGAAPSSLPPAWIAERESGGSYTAYNPTGCGGNGCYGKWQFSGAWAGKLGLPDDLSQATPEQQDAAARQLWNNGAGCSHWSACG